MRAALAVDRWQGWIGGLALAVLVQGCVTTGTTTNVASGQGSGSIEQAQAEAYDGPKARIAVARFTDKTGKGWYTRSIGDGMADMLTTSLVNTNRYIVLERQALGAVLDEQDLAASGRVREGTGAPTGQIEGAELLVVGAVTGLEGNSSGAKASGGGLLGGVLGGISGGFKKSYMAVDMRVIDTRTSRVVAATTVEGEATDVDLSGFGAGFGGGALGGSLSVWKDTPMEKALRIVIDRATQFVVSKTPRTYYHYGAGGRPSGGAGGRPPGGGGGQTVTVRPDTLNVRGGPGTGYPVRFAAHSGERLEVLGREGKWLRIRNGRGDEGWVANWLVD